MFLEKATKIDIEDCANFLAFSESMNFTFRTQIF